MSGKKKGAKDKEQDIVDPTVDADTNAPLAGWINWIETSRSRQVSALQAGGEKKRIRIPNERLAPARQAAVDLYEFGGGFARARFGAGPEDLYEEQESPREMLRRKQGYKVKTKKDLGELVNLRKAELAQQGGRGAAHLLHLEELIDEVEAQAEASSEESEEDDGESSAFALTGDQWKMLYMIAEYSSLSNDRAVKERWMPQVPLMVLVYEGIVNKLFSYDYSPSREIVGRQMIYFNYSQEGKCDIDTIRSRGFIFVLRCTDANHLPVVAYQASPEGRKALEHIPKQHQRKIDKFISAPRAMSKTKEWGDLMMVHWKDNHFILKSESGFTKLTKVTESEDVSYVSSPHLPFYVRARGSSKKKLSSNRGRAREATLGITNIDAEMTEYVKLDDVTVIIAEWLPFGANNIKTLAQKVGADERVSSGFYSATVDENPGATSLDVEPGLTNINIVDIVEGQHVNLEAEIYFPEEEGIVQVENFGVHIDVTGTCFCGVRMEAIQERIKNNISLDHLSRVLVDILQDSSRVLDTILSTRQRAMIELVYRGYQMNRPKFYLILCSKINPKKTAEEYLDRDKQENELRQVLGEVTGAEQITKNDCFIFGHNGIIVSGPNRFQYEQLLCTYAYLQSRHAFIGSVLLRMLGMMDTLREMRATIASPKGDPNVITHVHETLSDLSKDSVHLEEILLYSNEALKAVSLPRLNQQTEHEKTPRHVVYDLLKFKELMFDLERRSIDVAKHLHAVQTELWFVWRKSDDLYEARIHTVLQDVDMNFQRMVSTLNKAARDNLEQYIVIQHLFVALLAFSLMDRLVGTEWSVTGMPWMKDSGWFAAIGPTEKPHVWLLVGILLFIVIVYVQFWSLARKQYANEVGWATTKVVLKQPINLDALDDFIAGRKVVREIVEYSQEFAIVQSTWVEPVPILGDSWGGYQPEVTLEYDDDNGFVFNAYIKYKRGAGYGSHKARDLKDILIEQLVEANVIPPPGEDEEEAEVVEA